MTQDPRHPRDILRLLDESNQAGGVFLKDTTEYSLIEVTTEHNVYTIAPIDREIGEVAVQSTGRFAPLPRLATFSGSTWGGSAIRIRWFGIGMHMEFYLGPWSVWVTSRVRSIVLHRDPVRATALIAAAKDRKP
jgi:hypothetical protein